VSPLYAPIEPFVSGALEVGEGHTISWEMSGNVSGMTALVLHGGPGSARSASTRRYFDPSKYRIVMFDQRGCGRSTPHASIPSADLTTNTTDQLIDDIEALRVALGVDHWLVLGHSWGSVLGLTYISRHRNRVSHAILAGVGTGRHAEIERLYEGIADEYPTEWNQLLEGIPTGLRDLGVLEAYRQRLFHPDPETVAEAAHRFSRWEWATSGADPSPSWPDDWNDPAFRLARSRLVTHYFTDKCWLGDRELLDAARSLGSVPALIVSGERDPLAPLHGAQLLANSWPGAELVIVDDAGHALAGLTEAIVSATDRYAT
jgi:proline iminopeptidase